MRSQYTRNRIYLNIIDVYEYPHKGTTEFSKHIKDFNFNDDAWIIAHNKNQTQQEIFNMHWNKYLFFISLHFNLSKIPLLYKIYERIKEKRNLTSYPDWFLAKFFIKYQFSTNFYPIFSFPRRFISLIRIPLRILPTAPIIKTWTSGVNLWWTSGESTGVDV